MSGTFTMVTHLLLCLLTRPL